MSIAEKWLHRLANLNVYQAKHGRAPHKAIVAVGHPRNGGPRRIAGKRCWLTPELSYAFDTFWTVVKHRRTQPPDVRMPFHHLTTDRVWQARTADGRKSPHRSVTTHVRLSLDLPSALRMLNFATGAADSDRQLL
jgi:putative restriction endonuclease